MIQKDSQQLSNLFHNLVLAISDKIIELKKQFNSDLENLNKNLISLEELHNKYIGRKGLVNDLYAMLSKVSIKEKPVLGNEINKLKIFINDSLKYSKKSNDINLSSNYDDITLPPFQKEVGTMHPSTIIINKIKTIFEKIGFSSVYGPEIDSEYYNFEALNIPEYHPARDMQDTFYIDNEILLRTHTSGSQIHFMEKNEPPIRIISPGKVYRNEDISVRSHCQFHQVEGLYIDKNVSFADLKGTLNYFAEELFGRNIKTRFRPSFFPFTEPSAEMDVYWGLESESDYRITKGTGWLEILGCGMVDPEVFKSVDYDPEKWSGFAFGIGIERMAMLLYGIDDIRSFYQGDVRFLRQFK